MSTEIQVMPSYDDALNLTVLDKGDAIKVDFTKGFLSVWNDESHLETFDMLQFHFHAPAEHTIDGKYFALEVHLVHIDPSTGNLAVLGFYFDEEAGTKENEFLEALDLHHHNAVVDKIPLMNFIKEATHSKSFYQY